MIQSTTWRRARVILLSTILVLLVAYTGCDRWTAHRVARALQALEAKYGSVSGGASRAPKFVAPENRARLVSAAAALVNPGTDQERIAVRRFVADPGPKTVPPDLRDYMQTNAQALQMARQFVSRSHSGFDIDYRVSGDRPPLLDMRDLSNVIYMAALQSLEARQFDDAAALVTAGTSMSAAARHEPDLITQLIRVAVAHPPMDALRRLLEKGDPSKPALERLAHALAENRVPAPMTVGLLGEVRLIHDRFSSAGAGSQNPMTNPVPWAGGPLMSRVMRPVVQWFHAGYLEEAEALLDQQTGPRPRVPRAVRRPPVWAFVDRMSHTVTSGLTRAIETGDEFASQHGAAELAVALRRFKLDRGVYPEGLTELVPVYLPLVPLDPFTGQAPVYARDEEGFSLTVQESSEYATTKRPPVWRVAH